MRFHGLDLNLLVALDALLAERSVTAAAERLNLSQSATSNALHRLRAFFDDDLLVLRGRAMVPTARAKALVEPVTALLERIDATITVRPDFDPATSDRLVRIMASDYATIVLLAPAVREIQNAAPSMQIEIVPMRENPVEELERNQIDLLVTITSALSPDHPSVILFEDDHVVIGASENPALSEPLDEPAYLALGHVAVRFGKSRIATPDHEFLRRMKPARRVEVIAPSFSTLPDFLLGTARVATVYRHLARCFLGRYPLVERELPFVVPPIREGLQWNADWNRDPALRWVVARIEQAAAAMRSHAAQDSSSGG